jgi:hypothetical protein
MLASIGVLSAGEGGTYQLTPLGETLRTDGPNSVRDWALYIGALAPWTAWSHLYESVKTGTPGFILAHGMPTYDFLESHPELAACFNRWMSKQSDQLYVPSRRRYWWRSGLDFGGHSRALSFTARHTF